MVDVYHKDTSVRTFILFIQTAQAVLKYADRYLYTGARLSVIKLVALTALDVNDGTLTPSQLAKWTQTERHNITALVDRLKRDGLVTTKRESKDKRFVHVRLTDKGREVLNRTIPVAREVVNNVMSSVSEDDAARLEEQLKVLKENAFRGLE